MWLVPDMIRSSFLLKQSTSVHHFLWSFLTEMFSMLRVHELNVFDTSWLLFLFVFFRAIKDKSAGKQRRPGTDGKLFQPPAVSGPALRVLPLQMVRIKQTSSKTSAVRRWTKKLIYIFFVVIFSYSPESAKKQTNKFYLQPERSVHTNRSEVFFSGQNIWDFAPF